MPKRRRASIASRVPRSRRREGDICAQGSSVTEIRYLGRRSDGSHLVRVAWRFRRYPDDLMRCNNGTRLQLRLVARYLGGLMRERTIDLSRRPSREAHTAVIPRVGAADVTSVVAHVQSVTAFRQNARGSQRF
jgi:hypothetical protein